MNSALRFEFDVLRQDQERLHRLVANLDGRIEIFGRRLLESGTPASAPPLPNSLPTTPPPLPGGHSTEPSSTTAAHTTLPSEVKRRRPIPAEPAPAARSHLPSEPLPVQIKSEPITSPFISEDERGESSWEMAFGTVWLARIGIVILITGLVFLGNYAWQHVVSQLGAGGKLTLIYLAGALLGGLGAWLERGKETMRNYARVLMAGGAATVYYATYAAHYVERLRVIDSPVLGGTLLLAMAGTFIVWADRRRSQTIGLLAILLAYYTSAINAIGVFTLFSVALLTGAAVFLLARHRWTALGWVSLAGTYGSYFFWRGQDLIHHAAPAAPVETTLTVAVVFLAGYWLLFSSAAFFGKESVLADAGPSFFVTANNGAFFTLAAHEFISHRSESFWLFALLFGITLLGCARLARLKRVENPTLEGSYLAQGLALATLGLASKLTGYQLPLMLAFESALLLTGAKGRHSWLYQIGGTLTATLSVVVTGGEMYTSPHLSLPLGGTVAAVMIGNAWWLKQRCGQLTAIHWSWRSAWFAGLGLALITAVTLKLVAVGYLPLALAAVAVLLSIAARPLRLPELLIGQLLLGGAAAMLTFTPFALQSSPWSTPTVIVAALGLEQWWQRQRGIPVAASIRTAFAAFCAAGAMAVLVSWLANRYSGEGWILATSTAAVGTLLYGLTTRAWATAILGQIFTLLTAIAFVSMLWVPGTHAFVALVPVLTFAAIGIISESVKDRYVSALPEGIDTKLIALIYRLAATVGAVLWGLRFVPGEWLTPFFAAIGALLVVIATVTRNQERAITGAAFHTIALFTVWARIAEPPTWTTLLAIILVPASLRIARNLCKEEPLISEHARQIFTAGATGTAWLWVTCWTNATYGTQGLTIAWSALSLLTFAAGLGLQERVYRLGGFSILALAIGRVFLIDVWRLETLYRILSFLVLGAVLLLLGYVYNRFSEKIRRWM